MIRLAVADDDLLVREGIRHALGDEADIDIVAVAADRDELLDAVERESPDLVLTDIRMPPGHATEGIDIARILRTSHPGTGVIVVSLYAHPEYALALLESGAARRGYLLKDRLANRQQLVAAIKLVAAGGSAVDPQVVEILVRRGSRRHGSLLQTLSPREHEVLAEIAAGRSNRAIAERLFLSKGAVEQHVSAVFAKLELPREAEVSRRVVATLLFLADGQTSTAQV
jgi:DNA-binding NarL/FixJ family response regulator